jgi:hypothetical protein
VFASANSPIATAVTQNRAPQDLERAQQLVEQARALLSSGDQRVAIELARSAFAFDPDCLAAHRLIAEVTLAGEDFRQIFTKIHRHFRPPTYLEIGIESGATIRLVDPSTLAVGVDPAPRITAPLPSNVRVMRETSDAFFERDGVRTEFGAAPLAFAFIDGMHLFEFALRDFIHIERNATRDTRVLLHDCYPFDDVTAARARTTTFWTGDVWKVVACLRRHRPDLRVHTLAAPPSGLCVIRGLDPRSTVLPGKYAEICQEFMNLPLSGLGNDRSAALNLVPGDWQTAAGLLS